MAKKKNEIEEVSSNQVVEEEINSNNINKEEYSTDKKRTILISILLVVIVIGIILTVVVSLIDNNKSKGGSGHTTNNKLPKLPKPEVTEGERGKLGIDKNINEKVIDKYLGRSDAVYRDMRLLEDNAEYEKIGGDRFLSGYIDGFEVIPLPYIIKVDNLPEEVGYTYQGDTLFYTMSDGTYEPMYEESWDIINKYFPKDKVIFLMCGGGGYAGMMKDFLVKNGWDKNKIYNIGGHWYYNGKNNIEVPNKGTKAEPKYDFSNVPYHDIDFTELTPIKPNRHNKGKVEKFKLEKEYYDGNKDEKFEKLLEDYNNIWQDYSKKYGEYEEKTYSEFYDSRYNKVIDYINGLMHKKKSFVLTVYNDVGCDESDDTIRIKARKYAEDNNLYFYDLGAELVMQTDIYKDVKYYPNVIIVKNGKVYTFIDGESDEDSKIMESDESFEKWFEKYIIVNV